MVNKLASALVGLTVVVPAAQVPPASKAPTFEAASTKQETRGDHRVSVNIEGAQFIATGVSLGDLIGIAYGGVPPARLLPNQITGGPQWLRSSRFDVVARAQRPLASGDLPSLLQSLLADRFKLATHWGTAETSGYALLLSRHEGTFGPRLHRSAAECPRDGAAAGAPNEPTPSSDDFAPSSCGLRSVPGRMSGRAVSLSALARALTGFLADHRFVEDATGLQGNFDIDLTWMPDNPLPLDAPPGLPPIDPNAPALFTALQEQLGLKLEPRKVSSRVITSTAPTRRPRTDPAECINRPRSRFRYGELHRASPAARPACAA